MGKEIHTTGPTLFISMWALRFPAMRQQFQVQVPCNPHRVRQEEFISAQMKIALTFTAPSSAMQNLKTTNPADRMKYSGAVQLKFTEEERGCFVLNIMLLARIDASLLFVLMNLLVIQQTQKLLSRLSAVSFTLMARHSTSFLNYNCLSLTSAQKN